VRAAVARDDRDAVGPCSRSALAVRSVVEAAARHDVPLTLCGEMAGKPLEAMALLGLGFRSISMAPASLGPIKAMVLSLDTADLWERLKAWLGTKATTVREELKAYAAEKGVQI
jgi:phosphotransferase system enzyme I (PtsP)